MAELNNYREESEDVESLKIELEIVNSKNVQLAEENAILRYKLIRHGNEQIATSKFIVEMEMKIFGLEGERDKMFENLEKLKGKYNKLHTAYLEKMKRVKTLEEVFARQKMLPGLVKRSVVEQNKNEAVIHNSRYQKLTDENVMNSSKIAALQSSLAEAFDIIDELEFELESVDFLEMENERLKNELNKLKKKDTNQTTTVATATATTNNDDDDRRNEDHRLDGHDGSSTCLTEREQCGLDGLPDLESFEKSILTQSLNDTVEAESHFLRRDLLRSRLQHNRPPQRASGLQPQTPPPE